MTVESLPSFTLPAARLWRSIPAEARTRLLPDVRCVRCRYAVTITIFTGAARGGDLLLA